MPASLNGPLLLLWFITISGFRLSMEQGDISDSFSDHFNRMPLNPVEWTVDHKASDVDNELQYYTKEAVFVLGGRLHVRIDRGSIISPDSKQKYNYTSGRLTSTRYFKYGQFEWRAKIPNGLILQSSIDLFNPYWDDAIKIAQIHGSSQQTITSNIQVFKMGQSPTKKVHQHDTGLDLSKTFHYYRLSWAKDCIAIYFDETEIVRVSDPTAIPQSIMKIGMNVAVISDSPNNTMDSAEFLVDYLEVRPPVIGMCNGPPNATWPFPTSTTIMPSPQTIDWVSPSFNYNNFPYARFPAENATSTTTEPPVSPVNLASVYGTVGTVVFLMGLTVVVCAKRRRLQRRKGTMEKSLDTEMPVYRDRESRWLNIAYVRTGDSAFDRLIRKYAGLIEMSHENVKLSDHVLGKGEFGIVYKGTARCLGGRGHSAKWMTVAVKMMIHPNLTDEEKRVLGEEIRVMMRVGRHLNVVNLLGIVMKSNPQLVLEYCSFGSLLGYLKSHRGAYFYNHVDSTGQLLSHDAGEERHVAAQARQIASRSSGSSRENFDGQVMSSRDLINFSFQVCRGMEYLVSRSIIHRDLAARNILVTDKKIVKICDFGMARERPSVYVLENTQALLPVKWMPPEAILSKTFSQKSDVWSYGILLWEIFSLGETPYTDPTVGGSVSELLAWLEKGHRLDRPAASPCDIYDLQKRCWDFNGDDRPTFNQIRRDLDRLLADDQNRAYLVLDEPYQTFNASNEHLLQSIASSYSENRDPLIYSQLRNENG